MTQQAAQSWIQCMHMTQSQLGWSFEFEKCELNNLIKIFPPSVTRRHRSCLALVMRGCIFANHQQNFQSNFNLFVVSENVIVSLCAGCGDQAPTLLSLISLSSIYHLSTLPSLACVSASWRHLSPCPLCHSHLLSNLGYRLGEQPPSELL